MSKKVLKAKDRGLRRNKKRDFSTANANYDEAKRLSPREMACYLDKSATFFEEAKFDDCIATCETALIQNKIDAAKIMTRIAEAKLAQGKKSEALSWLEKASVEHPSPEINKMIADLRRPLSDAYASELFASLLERSDDHDAGARTRKLVYSSPVMSACFGDFMQRLTVIISDPNYVFFLSGSMLETVYMTKRASLTWIAPFIARLIISDTDPIRVPMNWAYDLLPQTSNVLKCFYLELDAINNYPMHPKLMPFIRRQVPNLQDFIGPIEIILAWSLPLHHPEPWEFHVFGVVIRQFEDFLTLFEIKRFTASIVKFMFTQASNSAFSNYLSGFMNFLNTTTIRFPETVEALIELPVLNFRLFTADFVAALCTVFPRLENLNFYFWLSAPEQVTTYSYTRMYTDYAFLAHEMTKMPPQLGVQCFFQEVVNFIVRGPISFWQLGSTIPPGFESLPTDDIFGIVNSNAALPICHGNKFFHYELCFHFM